MFEDSAGMCGDVNLYLNDPEDKHSAEIEVWQLPKSSCSSLVHYVCNLAQGCIY